MERVVIKVCSCGKEYTEEEWRRLEYLGISCGLEFRNCACRSTLTIQARYKPAAVA